MKQPFEDRRGDGAFFKRKAELWALISNKPFTTLLVALVVGGTVFLLIFWAARIGGQ